MSQFVQDDQVVVEARRQRDVRRATAQPAADPIVAKKVLHDKPGG